MYRNHAVAVVVPAHEEAAFVGDVVDAMPAFVDRIYVVDDASDDGTATAALTAADPDREPIEDGGRNCTVDQRLESDPILSDRVAETTSRGRVIVIRHGENVGPGGAVKTGYFAALPSGAGLVATVDGDGQMEPRQLARFLDPLIDEAADYAKGTRLSRQEHTRGMPGFRLFGNVLLTLLGRISSGYRTLTDPVNGYTAITRDALQTIDPGSVYEGYGYGIQVLARLHAANRRVVDVPTPSRYGDEGSGINVRRYVVRVSRLLFVTTLWRLRREWAGSRSGGLEKRFVELRNRYEWLRNVPAHLETALDRGWEP